MRMNGQIHEGGMQTMRINRIRNARPAAWETMAINGSTSGTKTRETIAIPAWVRGNRR